MAINIRAFATIAKSSKVFKGIATGGKVFFTLVDVADAGMDLYTLGSELNKALNGDPEMENLCNTVVTKGKAYDNLIVEVGTANRAIENLQPAISALYSLDDEIEDKSAAIFDKLDKLKALQEKLRQRIPASYAWFESTKVQKLVGRSDVTGKEAEQIKQRYGVDKLALGIASSSLAVRAGMFAFDRYKKAKAAGIEATPPPTRKRANARANIFEGMDANQVKSLQSSRRRTFTKVKNKIKTGGKIFAKAMIKIGALGSCGMQIYALVMKDRQRQADIKALNDMIAQYDTDIRDYTYVLKGCRKSDNTIDEEAVKRVAAVFELKDFNLNEETKDAKEALADGYLGVLKQYDQQLDEILDSIDATYASMITSFQEAQKADAQKPDAQKPDAQQPSVDDSVINNLKTAHTTFNSLKVKGKDEKEDSDKRKDALDTIYQDFLNSVVKQLKELDRILTQEKADLTSLNLLRPFTQTLVSTWKAANLPADQRVVTDDIIQNAKDALDAAAEERETLKTDEEIKVALQQLIKELMK